MGFFRKSKIYCDAAATTPLDRRVRRVMRKAERIFANPSSIYMRGKEASGALAEARRKVARVLSVRTEEIVFTSGGTESNNLAIQGVIMNLIRSGRSLKDIHAVTSSIEHSSVLKTFKALEAYGIHVTYLSAKEGGVPTPNELRKAIDKNTILVSLMYVNNETGTILPLREFGSVIDGIKDVREKEGNIAPLYFHTDASQAPLALHVAPDGLGVDLMTLDGHKIYGPKGVGALYVKHGTSLRAMLEGGGQEGGLRSTTESVPLASGFAEALSLAHADRACFVKNMEKARDAFKEEIQRLVPKAIVNGGDVSVPHIVDLYIPGIDAEYAVLKLDALGIECATKSSCMKNEKESYVIFEMTGNHARAKESLRFSFLRGMTAREARRVARILASVVQ